MSQKKKNSTNKNLYKIISALLVVAVIAAFYFINGGNPGKTPDDVQSSSQLSENAPQHSAGMDGELNENPQPSSQEETSFEEYTSPVMEVSTETSYDYYLTFYSDKLLNQHYDKHGKDMGFDSPEEYENAANKVIFHEETLHKTEKEDGDDVYYLEDTNEFVIVSTDGYIRTYFLPDDGLAYFNRQ